MLTPLKESEPPVGPAETRKYLSRPTRTLLNRQEPSFMKNLAALFLALLLFAPTPANEADVPPPDIELNFPEEPELQSFFQEYGKTLREQFLTQFQEMQAEGPIHNPWSLDVNGTVTLRSPFTAVLLEGYEYQGGAHGLPYLEVLYFEKGSGRQLSQESLLSPEAYDSLSALARQELVKQGFDTDDDWMLKGTEPTQDNYSLLVPTEEGVTIYFHSYQIAPYAAGVPTVEFAWPVVEGLFKPKYRPAR